MSPERPAILGLGCAAPAVRRTQEEALRRSLEISPPLDDAQRRQTEAFYRRSGVESRGVASAPGTDPLTLFRPATDDQPLGAPTSERMREYSLRAAPLAQDSARAALADAGVRAASITHLVTASCTGFAAPGWDIALMDRLGLPGSVLRTNVGYMGCHAAINALRVAEAFCRADRAARVLVCCTEVCSIHFRYNARPDQAVANALFADGSASAVVGRSEAGIARIASSAARVFPASGDQMGWAVGDHGFEMSLSTRLSATIRQHARPWLEEWLHTTGIGLEDIRSWAVHPGGPRILSAVGEAADLPGTALRPSREVLAAHGNMSSPTILFIFDRLRQSPGGPALPCILLSFGPGVASEALLLT